MQMSELSIIALSSGKPSAEGRVAPLLKRGLDLTGKDQAPNLLVIPTAKTTREAYEKTIADTSSLYQGRLKVPYRVLHGFEEMPGQSELDEQIEWADVIYIAGGDTDRMMKIWRKSGITSRLGSRALTGLVITGVSAGAIAPFVWGHSDSLSYRLKSEDEPWDYIKVAGLGLVQAAVTPHYNTTPNGISRADAFGEMFEQSGTKYGLGLDNMAGVEINGDTMTVLSVKKSAGVTLYLNRNSVVEKEQLGVNEKIDISKLTK